MSKQKQTVCDWANVMRPSTVLAVHRPSVGVLAAAHQRQIDGYGFRRACPAAQASTCLLGSLFDQSRQFYYRSKNCIKA